MIMTKQDRKQKKRFLPGLWLAAALLMLSLITGCGKGGQNAQNEPPQATPEKTEFELAEPEQDLAKELLEAAGQHPEQLQEIAESVLQSAGEDPEGVQDLVNAILQTAGEDPESAQSIAEAVLEAAGDDPEEAQDIANAVLEAAGEDPEEAKAAADKAKEALSSETVSGQAKEDSKPAKEESKSAKENPAIDEDGWYDSKDEVALYIHTYEHLPGNYITKKEAQKLGWPGGSLEPYAPGKSIGGDYFGNYEKKLPKVKGVDYHECDIGTAGRKSRGAKRIIFSDDGRIYYTDDHYETFTQLY